MTSLSACRECRGFVPPGATACVHCDAPVPRGGLSVSTLVTVAGAGVAAITLMACYGAPPHMRLAPSRGADCYDCYDTSTPSDASPVPAESGGDARDDAAQAPSRDSGAETESAR
jgi:hypothetical protein